MTYTMNTEAGFRTTSAEEWGFVCGRISVLEMLLLNRGFFEGVIKCKTIGDVRSTLAKTQYRQVFNSDDSVREYMGVLDKFSGEVFSDILKYTPPHVLNCFFNLQQRYLTFRNAFIRISGKGGSVAELESVFDSFVDNGIEAQAVVAHRAMLRGKETPQSAESVARSLYLDSVACSVKIALAESAPEESVRTILSTMAVLQSWSAILRSRWNGTSAEVVSKWFVLQDTYTDFIKETAALAQTNPVASLSGKVSDKVQRKLRNIPSDAFRQNIDSSANESIRDDMNELRYITYGPEKVVAYFVALGIELDNLRLALASAVNGIDSKIVAERFRKEYA